MEQQTAPEPSAPVDLNNLRASIGYDCEAEAMLLRIFVQSVDESFARLKSLASEQEETGAWAQQLHLIKGAALNVSATALVEALDSARASGPCAQRCATYHDLFECYQSVRGYILQHLQELES